MDDILKFRSSESPHVKAITLWTIGSKNESVACPDGCWDIVVYKKDGHTTILLTGQTTQAVQLPFSPGDEILTISFKASSFLSCFPATALVDQGEILPKAGNRFQLASESLEIPTFENADDFVKALHKRDILQYDEIVEAQLNNQPIDYSLRSIQRRFLRTTGMSPNNFYQIRRARQAAELLQKGNPSIQVAFEMEYSDQAHMSRTLKHILGKTPSELAAPTFP